jgi:prepilin-type N-terminal cleavage/methylation domain-containing protein
MKSFSSSLRISYINVRNLRRGFSLVELVIAIGIACLCAILIVQALQSTSKMLTAERRDQRQEEAIDALAARLEREAASSDAVWIAPRDGAPALNFALLDGSGTTRQWFYRFSTRLERGDPGAGTIAPVSEGEALTGITLQSLPASQLAQSQNDDAAFFANMAPISDAVSPISIVTLRAGARRRSLHLLATASAEGFGVERGLLWHSIVWRVSTTRRFLFGLAQKTEYHIWGEVAYTTDAWQSSQIWCSYDIYGPLDVSDPRAQSGYSDQAESASSIFAGCQLRTKEETVPYPTTSPLQATQ